MKEIEVKDLIKYINPFKKPMGWQLVGLDLVFYGENQWLQFMYIKHVIQNIFLIKQSIILYVLWIKNIKIN